MIKGINQVSGAWDNADFRRVWAALSVSLVGSEITAIALPLIAATTLHATPLEMGLLATSLRLPTLLLSLFAGVWVDHIRHKRPLMIWMDGLRAVLILVVPLAAFMSWLSLPLLYAVTFLLGSMTIFFEVSHYAYVPNLLRDDQILDGNSKLQLSHSAASSAGPGLAGLVIQWFSAPVALIINGLTYVCSALFLWRIRQPPPPLPTVEQSNLWRDMREGLDALLAQRLLGLWARCGAAIVFFTGAFEAQYILYTVQELHLNAGHIGLLAAVGGLAALPAATLTGWIARRFPVGKTIILGTMVWVLSLLLVPMVQGLPLWTMLGILLLGQAASGLLFTVANVQQWSLRQILTAPNLRARVSASNRFLIQGGEALGGFFGGLIAVRFGLQTAMLAFCVAALVCFIPLFFSSLWGLREMPDGSTTSNDIA